MWLGACQEWAAEALQVQLKIVYGNTPPKDGHVACTEIGPSFSDPARHIWLWANQTQDEEGHKSEHFHFICQEQARFA